MKKIFDRFGTGGADRNPTTAKHSRELTGAELDRIAHPTLGSGPGSRGNLLSNAELDRVCAAGGPAGGGLSGGGGSGNN
jgi:hypothetical protein